MSTLIKINPDGSLVEVINGVICVGGDFVSDHVRPLTYNEREKYSKILPGAAYIAGSVLMKESEGEAAHYAILRHRKATYHKRRELLERNVPGLGRLDYATRMFGKTDSDLGILRAQYPRAALYLKAESYSNSANNAKAEAGKEAMEFLVLGGSLKEVEAILNNWSWMGAW